MNKLPCFKKKKVEGLYKKILFIQSKSDNFHLEESRKIKANDPTTNATKQFVVCLVFFFVRN